MITEHYLELLPAYGRDYKTKAAVVADFRAGKDFALAPIMYGGFYCSIRDFAPNTSVVLRFNGLRSTTTIEV